MPSRGPLRQRPARPPSPGATETPSRRRDGCVVRGKAGRSLDEANPPAYRRNTSRIERTRRLYEFRQRRFKIRAGKIEDEEGLEEGSLLYQRMMHEIYTAQRRALVGLRNSREISSDVMRRVERELDLEESRLEV